VASPPTLSTDRLRLRAFGPTDAPWVQRLAGAPEIAATTLNVPHPYRDGMAESWIASHPELFARGLSLHLAIEVSGGEPVGALGARFSDPHRRADIGYWIGVPYWGAGYATEAAARLLVYLFRDRKLERVTCQHLAENDASRRVIEKLGFRREGRRRRHYIKLGRPHDAIVYGLLADEWAGEG
jgi:RimJ/RimL family protein N-acetyltransferase